MLSVQNQNTVKELRLATGLPAWQLSTEIDKKVVPVIDVNPKNYRIANIVRETATDSTGSAAMYTTPTAATKRRFFLTSCTMGAQADATADSRNYDVIAIINGVTQAVARMRKLTTTAWSGGLAINFDPPIPIDPGTAIGAQHVFTVGASSLGASITGFEVEDFENN